MTDTRPVYLNVGGALFVTTMHVLTRYKGSTLAEMFTIEQSKWITDRDGNVFIDRDGSLFRYILNFLRDDKLNVPTKFTEFDLLLQEAVFYKLEKLQKSIEQSACYRRNVVLINKGRHDPSGDVNIYVVVKTNETTSRLLKKQFKHELSFAPVIQRYGLYTTYYEVETYLDVKIFLTEQGFKEIQLERGSFEAFVKDI